MKTKQVKKLTPEERFFYWIKERHNLYLKKERGEEKPWTDDEVLQSFFFTNPYRENDKVTKWFRENIREPLRDDPRVLFATIAFRWFNLPRTGEILIRKGKDFSDYDDYGWLEDWKMKHVVRCLSKEREKGKTIFTGAFMINSPPGERKLEAICRRINNVWKDREKIILACDPSSQEGPRMESVHNVLTSYEGLGGFMAYEVVCDLRYTYFLDRALDRMTWCNPGPGCIRGLYRLAGKDWDGKGNNASAPPKPKDWIERMKELLESANSELDLPLFEMREIEHSLCEFDKYERALFGDGKMKRRYNGV